MPSARVGRGWTIRGLAKYNLDDYKGALADFDRAMKLVPPGEIANCLFNRSLVKKMLGDTKGEAEDLSRAIKLNPKYANR